MCSFSNAAQQIIIRIEASRGVVVGGKDAIALNTSSGLCAHSGAQRNAQRDLRLKRSPNATFRPACSPSGSGKMNLKHACTATTTTTTTTTTQNSTS